ncbi:hypothetical protein, partial [Paenibacillus motobuensis]|uniref:hypothetical protein n=1 Tax=Paenibacillus motobuensis TaxID=295324 RepID=UPI0031CF64CB
GRGGSGLSSCGGGREAAGWRRRSRASGGRAWPAACSQAARQALGLRLDARRSGQQGRFPSRFSGLETVLLHLAQSLDTWT